MPLQLGNTWVYYSESHTYPSYIGTSKIKYKVIGLADTLGKRYFRLQITEVNISGIGGCPFLPLLLRIDSVSMNFCSPGNNCYSNENIIDSLPSRMNDTAVTCIYTYRICTDTSSMNIMNISFPTKKFTNERWNSSLHYSKGIGPVYYGWGEAMNWCFANIRGCIINGVLYGDTSMLVGINQISSEVPEKYSLLQNYPNPFNPSTNIRFSIPQLGDAYMRPVQLIVYDALGREVQILADENLSPGTYEVDFDGSNLPSGVYYYKLEVSDPSAPLRVTETKKMVLIK